MTSLIYGGIYKCAQNPLKNGLCKMSKYNNVQQVAFLSRKADRENRPPRPPPFPYKEKKYMFINSTFDPLLERFDDNSKVIIVEGPPTAGKTKLAADIAKEFDMLHVSIDPTANYTDVTGRDLRYYTKTFAEEVQILGLEDVVANPRHINVASFEFTNYHVKFLEYVRALLHVLLSGQGVVIESSVFTHNAYVNAMVKQNFLSRKIYDLYDFQQERSLPDLILPHMVIYLDLPVDEAMQRIKKRNLPHEANSELLSREFLSHVDSGYKKFLNYITPHSHILTLDMTKKHDTEDILQEIETTDLYTCSVNDPKMRDWIWETEQDLKAYIYSLIQKQFTYGAIAVPINCYGIPQLQLSTFNDYLFDCVRYEKDPKEIHKPGFINKVEEGLDSLKMFLFHPEETYDPFDLVQRAERYTKISQS